MVGKTACIVDLCRMRICSVSAVENKYGLSVAIASQNIRQRAVGSLFLVSLHKERPSLYIGVFSICSNRKMIGSVSSEYVCSSKVDRHASSAS